MWHKTYAREFVLAVLAVLLAVNVAKVSAEPSGSEQPRTIGSRLEPLMDDWLIDRMKGVELRLHHPTPKEIAITFDKPWEGNVSAYVTVFQDGDRFRMYYRGADYDLKTRKSTPEKVCYAESTDGIHWTKPELNLFEFNGSKQNNIVWRGEGGHNFAPFRDANPKCPPEARYKALGSIKGGLLALQSSDGIRWSVTQKDPVITKGAFDSQNLAFWDTLRERYVDFHRGFRNHVRDIMTSTSGDFIHWTDPEWLDYGGIAPEHLYTNAVTPYPRAPHIFLGFPKRFVETRTKSRHQHTGVSDGVFMTSRDGVHFHRWQEALIRPGLQVSRWENRNNMTAWGILTTKADIPGSPDELSIYSSEGYYVGPCSMRRFTIRLDGFVSVNAGYGGGEIVTRPLVFEGKHLVMNYSTSSAGSLRVEIQDAGEKPIEGYSLTECPEIYGDSVAEAVGWKNGRDVGKLAGKPLRLRFVLKDADLYAIRFASEAPRSE